MPAEIIGDEWEQLIYHVLHAPLTDRTLLISKIQAALAEVREAERMHYNGRLLIVVKGAEDRAISQGRRDAFKEAARSLVEEILKPADAARDLNVSRESLPEIVLRSLREADGIAETALRCIDVVLALADKSPPECREACVVEGSRECPNDCNCECHNQLMVPK